jgi:DNA polymerase
MEGRSQNSLAAEFAAALDWWRDAGVDLDYADDASRWLTPPEAKAAKSGDKPRPEFILPKPEPLPPRVTIGGDKALWPQTLSDFADWWLTEPTLDNGMIGNRVPPRGPAMPELMVVVAEPEVEDGHTLLSGPQGSLLAAMLAAMGIAPERTYVASALPRHMPLPDWGSLATDGLGMVLKHHVGLVAPRRLLVFGNAIPPLLSNDPAQKAADLRHFNHEGRTIPLLGAHGLDVLLNRPRFKASLWQRWLDWTGTGA